MLAQSASTPSPFCGPRCPLPCLMTGQALVCGPTVSSSVPPSAHAAPRLARITKPLRAYTLQADTQRVLFRTHAPNAVRDTLPLPLDP